MGYRHVLGDRVTRAPDGATVAEGTRATVPVGHPNVLRGGARRALGDAAVGAGAGLGC